jgi:hypothetical protein
MESALPQQAPSQEALDEESRRIRRLRIAVELALAVISQGQLSYREVTEMMTATRELALRLFPGKAATYDLIYLPRFYRVLREVYGE